jgi:hypothetical protein
MEVFLELKSHTSSRSISMSLLSSAFMLVQTIRAVDMRCLHLRKNVLAL